MDKPTRELSVFESLPQEFPCPRSVEYHQLKRNSTSHPHHIYATMSYDAPMAPYVIESGFILKLLLQFGTEAAPH